MTKPVEDEVISHYSRALDRVYVLQAAFAAEIKKTKNVLELKSLPKTARIALEEQIIRMTKAAKGDISSYPDKGRQQLLEDIGASSTLTRSEWEVETEYV